MSKRKPQFDFWTIVTIGILAVFALFLIYPLISLFVDGFLEEAIMEKLLEFFYTSPSSSARNSTTVRCSTL